MYKEYNNSYKQIKIFVVFRAKDRLFLSFETSQIHWKPRKCYAGGKGYKTKLLVMSISFITKHCLGLTLQRNCVKLCVNVVLYVRVVNAVLLWCVCLLHPCWKMSSCLLLWDQISSPWFFNNNWIQIAISLSSYIVKWNCLSFLNSSLGKLLFKKQFWWFIKSTSSNIEQENNLFKVCKFKF